METPGTWVIADIDMDAPRHGELVLDMVAVGLCHSDDHFSTGDLPPGLLPFAGGHEDAGIVSQVGPDTPGGKPIGQAGGLSTFCERSVVVASCVKVDKDIPLNRAVLVGCGVGTGWGSVGNRGLDIQLPVAATTTSRGRRGCSCRLACLGSPG